MALAAGFVILAHRHLNRAAHLAQALAQAGAGVVVHVDANCPDNEFAAFARRLGPWPGIAFSPRLRCAWGRFSLVQASQVAAGTLLDKWPRVSHVCQISGDTLPIQPVAVLLEYLRANPDTDFIESFPAETGSWIKGGLGAERNRLYFPFSWREHRRMFDLAVEVQRRLRVSRHCPAGLNLHFGSQWWCLTGQTLKAILRDGRRAEFDRFFRHGWIPDESYFQSLARRHSTRIESRSLVLSRFDNSGVPHVFHDDHAGLLAESGAFLARKIWPGADGLYQRFPLARAAPVDGQDFSRITRLATEAEIQRVSGRKGLVMQGRYPLRQKEYPALTARPYHVFCGFEHLFPDFRSWLGKQMDSDLHGRIFGPLPVAFAGSRDMAPGSLSNDVAIRNWAPEQFLRSLVWANSRTQGFQFEALDNPALAEFLARDAHARVHLLAGAWMFELFRTGRPASELKQRAQACHAAEKKFCNLLAAHSAYADTRIWSVEDYIDDPAEVLHQLHGRIYQSRPEVAFAVPDQQNLAGFRGFLLDLRNAGVARVERVTGKSAHAVPDRDGKAGRKR